MERGAALCGFGHCPAMATMARGHVQTLRGETMELWPQASFSHFTFCMRWGSHLPATIPSLHPDFAKPCNLQVKHLPRPLCKDYIRGCKAVAHVPWGTHRPALCLTIFLLFISRPLLKLGYFTLKIYPSLLFGNIRILDTLEATSASLISWSGAAAAPKDET